MRRMCASPRMVRSGMLRVAFHVYTLSPVRPRIMTGGTRQKLDRRRRSAMMDVVQLLSIRYESSVELLTLSNPMRARFVGASIVIVAAPGIDVSTSRTRRIVLMMGPGETGRRSCLAMFNMKNNCIGRYVSTARAYCKAGCMLHRSV
eukprot:1138607-Rhodomonas_salina.2